MTIIETMTDPALFARWFWGDSWRAWRVVLKVLFALPLDDAELQIFRSATGRSSPPLKAALEAWLLIGRRGGKSIISALIVVYLACFRDYAPFVAPGEIVTIMLVAADRKQARAVMRYVRAFIFQTPLLRVLVVRETRESIELSTGVAIEIHTNSRVSTRSYTLGGVVNDELCFWPSAEAAQPGEEVLIAERPALATIPGSLMLNVSTGYSRAGPMYSAFESCFGKDGAPLFWKAPSRALPEHEAPVEMNPLLDLEIVRRAYEDDPIAAASEWGAAWRSDVEQLFTLEMLETVTDYDRPQILPYTEEEEVA